MPLPKASPPPSLMSPSLASSSVPFLSSSSALPLSPIPISTSSLSTKQNGEQQVHVSHLLDHNRQNSNHENRLVAIDFGASRHIATHSMVRRVKAAAYLSSEGAERENDSLASCLTPAFDGNKPLASAYSCPPEAFYCLQNENEVCAHQTIFNLTATTSVPPSLPPSLLSPSLANGFDGHDGGDKDDDSECGNVEVLSCGQTETNGVLRGAQSEIESTATLSRAIKESAKSLGGYAAQEARDGRWFAVRSAFPHFRTGSNDHKNQNHSSPDEHDPDVHSTHLQPPERVASTLNLPYDPLTASVASDVWALGCILFFLASGGQPLVPTDPRDEVRQSWLW
jgi:serine/threonine protein kinase